MDLQGQIDSTVTMALQNKKTLDMLAATWGGTCAVPSVLGIYKLEQV
jgi:hypothetical protein